MTISFEKIKLKGDSKIESYRLAVRSFTDAVFTAADRKSVEEWLASREPNTKILVDAQSDYALLGTIFSNILPTNILYLHESNNSSQSASSRTKRKRPQASIDQGKLLKLVGCLRKGVGFILGGFFCDDDCLKVVQNLPDGVIFIPPLNYAREKYVSMVKRMNSAQFRITKAHLTRSPFESESEQVETVRAIARATSSFICLYLPSSLSELSVITAASDLGFGGILKLSDSISIQLLERVAKALNPGARLYLSKAMLQKMLDSDDRDCQSISFFSRPVMISDERQKLAAKKARCIKVLSQNLQPGAILHLEETIDSCVRGYLMTDEQFMNGYHESISCVKVKTSELARKVVKRNRISRNKKRKRITFTNNGSGSGSKSYIVLSSPISSIPALTLAEEVRDYPAQKIKQLLNLVKRMGHSHYNEALKQKFIKRFPLIHQMAMDSIKCNEYPMYNDQAPYVDWSGLDIDAAESWLRGNIDANKCVDAMLSLSESSSSSSSSSLSSSPSPSPSPSPTLSSVCSFR
jgi:hypothetical protein